MTPRSRVTYETSSSSSYSSSGPNDSTCLYPGHRDDFGEDIIVHLTNPRLGWLSGNKSGLIIAKFEYLFIAGVINKAYLRKVYLMDAISTCATCDFGRLRLRGVSWEKN